MSPKSEKVYEDKIDVDEKMPPYESVKINGKSDLEEGRWEDTIDPIQEEIRKGEGPRCWAEVENRLGGGEGDEEEEVVLSLELCEAFYLSYALGQSFF